MGDMTAIRPPFTVAKLAEHWDVSDTFIYTEIHAGRLKAMRFGGKLYRIKPEAVEEYECRACLTESDVSLELEKTGQDIGHSASNGLTSGERTASRLGRMIERPQRPRLVSSGAKGR
ncbi:DNA-binding protein [Sphingomonas crocodyli]|uniref:DNA-binding protein n=1 Tax=Sphingomonas crocodyli TaxID=1979270 RepID=A0A437M840_9SPHN|nr:DNA-binding protein [Sphingomonas crocodyli]